MHLLNEKVSIPIGRHLLETITTYYISAPIVKAWTKNLWINVIVLILVTLDHVCQLAPPPCVFHDVGRAWKKSNIRATKATSSGNNEYSFYKFYLLY